MRRTILDQSDAREMFDALIRHWGQANALLESEEKRHIVLAGGYSRLRFLNDAVAFEHLGDSIEEAARRREGASDDLAQYKAGMRRALETLSHFVHGHFAGAALSREFPPLPDVRSAEGRILGAMAKASEVWAKIDALPASEFEGPLVLPDGTTAADFAVGVRLLARSFAARASATEQERVLRSDRRTLHKMLIARAVQYRRVLFGLFPEDSETVRTFPYLWPKQDRRRKKDESIESDEALGDRAVIAAASAEATLIENPRARVLL